MANKKQRYFRKPFNVSMLIRVALLLFVATYLLSNIFVKTNTSYAATSSYLNFQARLLNSAGNIVPDGDYNIEYKIYDSASSGASAQGVCVGGGTDDCQWVETRTGANKITLKNGYFSVQLGSVASLPSISWDQDLWLTMNIGGSGSPSWDGEMTPRIKLTSVPYALAAGQLAKLTGANTSTLGFATQTAANTILLPDAGGTLAIATGGTLANNGVLYGNGTTSIQATAAGTTGQCMVATTSAAPSWGSCAGTGSGVTLQAAYDNSSSPALITTADGKNLRITLQDTATDQSFEITQAGAANAFRVNDDGTYTDSTPFVIDASGNVGIGTVSPETKLHVSGGHILLDNNWYLEGKDTGGTVRNLLGMGSDNRSLLVSGSSGFAVRNSAQTADFLTINGLGNVGIGTASPSETLQVAGGLKVGSGPSTMTVINQVGGISAGDTSVTVVDTTGYPSAGTLFIDLEAITYTGKTGTSFTGLGRGAYGTTAASHSDGVTVEVFLQISGTSATAPAFTVRSGGKLTIGTAVVPSWATGYSIYAASGARFGSSVVVSDDTFYSWGDSTTRFVGNGASDYIYLYTNGAERIRVNSTGNLLFNQASTIKTNDKSAGSTNSDNITLSTGNATGATSNSGNITMDVGTATGTAGTIGIGTTNSSGITVGSGSNTFSLQTSNIDISSAGAISGITGYTQDSGNFAMSGAGTFGTGTGAISLNGATTVTGTNTFTSGTGAVSLQGDTTISAAKYLATLKGTDYSTTGTTNNISIPGSLIRLTGASAQTITGIAGGTDGRILTIVNAASQAATLSNNSGSSTAANRIITGSGSDLSLAAGASITLIYDSGASFWRVVGGVAGGAGTCPTCANQQLSNLSSVAINTALLPGADNTIDLGSSSYSFRTLYSDTSVLTPNVDVASAGTLSLGTSTATAITIGKTGVTTTNAGALTVSEATNLNGATLTIGDASGDAVTVNSSTWTFANDTNLVLSGGINGLSFDTDTLSIDATNNRVGIGTTAPSYQFELSNTTDAILHIAGDSDNSGGDDGTQNAVLRMSTDAGTGGFDIKMMNGTGTSRIDFITINGPTTIMSIADTGRVGIGTASPNAKLELAGNASKSAWGLNGIQLQASSGTYTDSSTAISGTATNAVFNSFATPTLAASNTSVTTTNAATVYIQGAPTAGTNQTITNAYAMWVDGGTTRMDGDLIVDTNTLYANSTNNTVSIGTTTSYGKLHIQGGEVTTNSGGSYTFNSYWNGANDKYVDSDSAFAIWHDGSTDRLVIESAASGTAGNNITYSEILVFDAVDGSAVFKNSSDSNFGFVVQKNDGTSLLNVDTSIGNVSVRNVLNTFDQGCGSCNSIDLFLRSGNATGATSNSGNITMDVGTATGTAGTISIGTTNSSGITVGSGSNTFSLQTSNIDISSAGAISGGTTYTGSGNINTTAGVFQLNGTDINTAGTLTNVAYENQANVFTLANTFQNNITLTNAGYLATQRATDFSTTGTTNDANLGSASLVRLTGASAQTITGIAGGADGRILTIVNAGSNAATLSNNSGSSTAANRIITGSGSNLSLLAGASITLIYDSGASFWRVSGAAAGAGGGSGDINQNGNSFTADMVLGTNDSYNLAFETGGTTKWLIDTNGHLLPNTDDTYDIGSTSARVRDLYLGPGTLHVGTGASDEYTFGYDTTNNTLELQAQVDAVEGFQVLDVDGGTAILNVDTSNERVGIGTNAPGYKLTVVEGSTSTTAADQKATLIDFVDTGVVTTGNDITTGLSVSVTRTGATGGTIDTYAGNFSAQGDSGGSSNVFGVNGTAYGADVSTGVYGGTLLVGTGTSLTGAIGVNGQFNTFLSSGASLSYAYGLQGGAHMDVGTATITDAAGLFIQSATNGSGGTITNNYGIKVAAQTVGSSNFGIAVEAANTQTLWLSSNADNTTAAAGIAFGSSRDTNLYRSAANTLKTDDSLLISPTANSAVGLTVNGTTGTAAVAMSVSQTGAANAMNISSSNVTGNILNVGNGHTSGARTNAVYIENTDAGGTVTNLLHLYSMSSATNGLNLTGTFSGNLINSTNFTVSNGGNADFAGTLTSGTANAFTVSAGGAIVGVGVNSGTGLLQGTGGLTLTGSTLINTTGTATTGIGNGTGALTVTGSSGSNFVLNSITTSAAEFNVLDSGIELGDLTTQGTATDEYCLTSETGGGALLAWQACGGGGGGADTALSNLASVNINAALNKTGGTLTLQTTTSGDISLLPVGNVTIGTSDTTGTLLKLDEKTSEADPTGSIGGMYYNSSKGKFRCYERSVWIDCTNGGETNFGRILVKEEFLNAASDEAGEIGELGWDVTLTGTATDTSNNAAADSDHIGIYQCASSATNPSGCRISTGSSQTRIWGGETIGAVIRTPSNLTATNMYVGLGDATTGTANSTDAVQLRMISGTANWEGEVINNGTSGTCDTGVAATASNYVQVKIVINTAANSTAFYLNGATTASCTIANGLPTGSGRDLGPIFQFRNADTTAAKTGAIDMFYYEKYTGNRWT